MGCFYQEKTGRGACITWFSVLTRQQYRPSGGMLGSHDLKYLTMNALSYFSNSDISRNHFGS